GGAVTLAQYPAGPYPIGQTNVTLVVHDDEGDSAVCLSTVTVRDLTPPTVTCPGDTTITIQEGETCVAVNHVASAFDFCGLQSLTAAPPSGFCFPVGATLVTVIGTDLAGNADTCTFTVTVETEGGQLEAVLDIKPGSCPNPVNVERNWNKSKAVLPVAILGTMDFDVHEIDPMTVRLEGVAPLRWSFENVSRPVMDPEECECTSAGPDRIMDMTLKFQLSEILAAIAPLSHGTEVLLTLTGLTEDGDEFVASDCIRVIGDLTSLPKVAMVPGDFGLTNSPNPFNAGTVIQYALPEDGSVRLEIFNILGQSMGVLVNEFQAAGPHSVSWDGRDVSGAQVPSGIYLYRLQAGAEMTTRKMVLMK
ncbi:MAG TPA: HYR domain-containing protein, partial [bacterium]|nr:HYR domain-containing protein [bacterium]